MHPLVLSRQAILEADDLPTETVAVPEWGGDVQIRVMSGLDRIKYETAITTNKEDVIVALLAVTLCDEGGKLLFETADIAALASKSSKALARVFDRAIAFNKLRPADTDQAEKN